MLQITAPTTGRVTGVRKVETYDGDGKQQIQHVAIVELDVPAGQIATAGAAVEIAAGVSAAAAVNTPIGEA